MRLILLVALSMILVSTVSPQEPAPIPPLKTDTEERLPNGKSQKDAIAKADYEASVKDARELVRLAGDLQAEIEKNESFVVSISEIHKTEEIEKLSKRIRGRLKRY